MKWALVVELGGHKGRVIPIRVSPLIIGRDDDCQLRTSNPYVSHHHCELLTEDGKIILRDCNSTNGTFINGQKVAKEAELHEGDQVKIGPMAFVVHQTNNAKAHGQPDDKAHGPRSVGFQPVEPESSPKRPVDEDAIGEMLLEMDQKGEQNGVPPGSWKNPGADDFRNSPEAPIPPRDKTRDSDPAAAKIASRMLKGKGDWLKRRSAGEDL